jgi:hypothetical protein
MLNWLDPKHRPSVRHWAIIPMSGSLSNATFCAWSIVVQVRLHTSFSNGLSQDVKDKAHLRNNSGTWRCSYGATPTPVSVPWASK